MDTLKLADEDEVGWTASGVVPRSADASYGILVVPGESTEGGGTVGSIYSAHNQVSLPTDSKTAANVIARSELNDVTTWDYHYRENADSDGTTSNGLHRSSSIDVDVDPPWLEQPDPTAPDQPATTFTSPWTKSPADGYVYFGLSEFEPESKTIKSRLARVCKEESAPPDTNNFASFLKMEVTCNGGTYNLDADQITAAVAGVGTNAPVYVVCLNPTPPPLTRL
jgi:hypothetical protein